MVDAKSDLFDVLKTVKAEIQKEYGSFSSIKDIYEKLYNDGNPLLKTIALRFMQFSKANNPQ